MPDHNLDLAVVAALERIWKNNPNVEKLGLRYDLGHLEWTSYGCEIPVTATKLAGLRASQIDDVMREIQRQLDDALGPVNDEYPNEVHLFLDVFGEAA